MNILWLMLDPKHIPVRNQLELVNGLCDPQNAAIISRKLCLFPLPLIYLTSSSEGPIIIRLNSALSFQAVAGSDSHQANLAIRNRVTGLRPMTCKMAPMLVEAVMTQLPFRLPQTFNPSTVTPGQISGHGYHQIPEINSAPFNAQRPHLVLRTAGTLLALLENNSEIFDSTDWACLLFFSFPMTLLNIFYWHPDGDIL
ncbi:hypothetical protein CROQUDRAFT_96299 [Cronartium quercuum f. sp. fusiforme G11]|uniref:Uncharacterized protein n=1 Tax=Cronartium quercuum f. sp. fusiforme G11 TaxID=708437 RepID=A0A9P6T8W4_9BASI|nr:hypothetical protein CROQUDRAFT_96299 [Cronartium quercuum f. sp. fusiforme G11]